MLYQGLPGARQNGNISSLIETNHERNAKVYAPLSYLEAIP